MSFTTRAVAFAKLWLFPLVVASALLAPGFAGADGRPFNRIVVFGDSLSDPGNAFALYGRQTIAPPDYGMTGEATVPGIPVPIPEAFLLIPDADAPYASHRFSNGPTWIELLAGAIGMGSNAKPAFDESSGRRAANYAVAGATAADLTAFGGSPHHLREQVETFFYDVNASKRGVPSDAIYVIAIGGNDVRAALANPAVLGLAVQSVASVIQDLHAAGARKFLVWSAPDLGRAPALLRLNGFCPAAAPDCFSAGATMASAGYNQGLQTALAGLSAAGIDIVPFDAFALMGPIQADPQRYGLTNATDACIQPFVPPLFRCAEPDRYFFWDGIHPTRAGHAIIAFLVGKQFVKALAHDD